jgi:hypothetical protein
MHRSIRVFTVTLAVAAASCASDAGDPRSSYYEMGGAGNLSTLSPGAPVPPMNRARKVAEQDCGKAVDPGAGNLRCR